MMLGLKKGKKIRNQMEALIQETEAEAKVEIVTTDMIKVKALKGLYFHQEITKTEAQEIKPRIIVKNMRKRNIFPKGRTTSEKFETIVIRTNGNNRNVRLAEQQHEVHIIPETQLSQNDEGEDVQVSTEKNNFLFHGQGAVHGRHNQKQFCLQKYLIYLAILFLKTKKTF